MLLPLKTILNRVLTYYQIAYYLIQSCICDSLFPLIYAFDYIMNFPVMLSSEALISAGVPLATTLPPSSPPPGPMSMM